MEANPQAETLANAMISLRFVIFLFIWCGFDSFLVNFTANEGETKCIKRKNYFFATKRTITAWAVA